MTKLYSRDNNLSSLNVANGNNANFVAFQTNDNPNLFCIQTDDAAFAVANWTGGNYLFDSWAFFSEDCSPFIGVANIMDKAMFKLYPNPANSVLNVEIAENMSVKLVNLLGETVLERQLQAGTNVLDIDGLVSGVYFLMPANNNAATHAVKFIKE